MNRKDEKAGASNRAGKGRVGRLAPGNGMNIRAIAQAAGVSIATVSRVLRPEQAGLVSEKVREHVLQLCEKLHYVPNVHSRRVFRHRSDTIAFFFHSSPLLAQEIGSGNTDLNFSSSLMGAQRILAEQGLDLLLCELNEGFFRKRRHIEMVRQHQVDGILLWGANDSDDFLQELAQEQIPLVQISSEHTGSLSPCVVADEYGGMRHLAELVLAAGHTRIAVLQPPQSVSIGRQLRKAILDTLAVRGIPLAAQSASSGFGYEFGRQATRELLAQGHDFTCIMAPDDMAAWGCIEECRTHGLSVPSEISITGADNQFVPGPLQLISYRRPTAEIASAGTRMLLSLLKGETPSPPRLVLPTRPVSGNTLVYRG